MGEADSSSEMRVSKEDSQGLASQPQCNAAPGSGRGDLQEQEVTRRGMGKAHTPAIPQPYALLPACLAQPRDGLRGVKSPAARPADQAQGLALAPTDFLCDHG